MNWILNHASEIAVAIIVFCATKGIDYFFAKRPKVVAFFTHGAQFPFANPGWQGNVNTMALALQNTGRAAAEGIRIVHRRRPLNYQVYPPTSPTESQLPTGEWELRIPSILPKQIVFVSYLDAQPLDPSLISYMASKEQVIQQIRIYFTHAWPRWSYWLLSACLTLGVLVILRHLYLWGTEIIRYLVTH